MEKKVGLEYLPVEVALLLLLLRLVIHHTSQLLYDIHLLALSPVFPLVSPHLKDVFDGAPNSLKAQYILGNATPPNLYSKALRYRLCTAPVLDIICARSAHVTGLSKRTEVPKHIFKGLSSQDDHPLPFLRHIDACEGIPPLNVNAHSGFALSMAVHAGCVFLVRWLLDKGAKPDTKGALAVVVAIRQKDLSLVRMLVEPQYRYLGKESIEREVKKKRRIPDRVVCKEFPELLKTAMKRDARDIVDYLREKGCVPDWGMIKLQWTQ
jgi:hypothetical protein